MFLDLSTSNIIYWFPVMVDEDLAVLQGPPPTALSFQYSSITIFS